MLRLCWALARLARYIWHWLRDLPRRAALALGAEGPDQPARPDRLRRALALVLPLALFVWWAMPQLTIVMTPSIEAWVVTPAPGPIAKGDYVQYLLSHPIAGPKPVSVTKHALCMPGDRLTTIERASASFPSGRDGYYFCNGVPLGVSLPMDIHGQKLDHLHWNGIVPAGMAYIGSHHPRGFDSRYFGLVRVLSLTRMRRLL